MPDLRPALRGAGDIATRRSTLPADLGAQLDAITVAGLRCAFTNVAAGPFDGRLAIEQAYYAQPPTTR